MAAQLSKVKKDIEDVVFKIDKQLLQIDKELSQVDDVVEKDFQELISAYVQNLGCADEETQQRLSKHRVRLKIARIDSLNKAKNKLLNLKQEIQSAYI